MKEAFVTVDGGEMFIRHSEPVPGSQAVVWIHGIGESSLCFAEAFSRPELRRLTLIAPDMLGFGRSSRADDGDYSFAAQVRRLWTVCDHFGINAPCLVGHSMGGDIATVMAASAGDRPVRAIVNAEGDLTPEDVFVSNRAVEAARRGEFDRWFFEEFMETTVLRGWGADWPASRRYYASLWYCRPEAFLASAEQVLEHNPRANGPGFSAIGEAFVSLAIPKFYCWTDKCLSEASRALLASCRIANVRFDNSFHWMMIDCPDRFYGAVASFIHHHASETDA